MDTQVFTVNCTSVIQAVPLKNRRGIVNKKQERKKWEKWKNKVKTRAEDVQWTLSSLTWNSLIRPGECEESNIKKIKVREC